MGTGQDLGRWYRRLFGDGGGALASRGLNPAQDAILRLLAGSPRPVCGCAFSRTPRRPQPNRQRFGIALERKV